MGQKLKIYFAGRYGRREELKRIAEEIEERFQYVEVTSRWLNGEHESKDGSASVEEMGECAQEDLADIERSDMVWCFTEEPGVCSRGGRHVELGYALDLFGDWNWISIIGPVENVFCALPNVRRFAAVEEAIQTLLERRKA